jgi:hypothetical protein
MNLSAISIKDISIIGGFIITLSAFYFSTGYRLENLEAKASDIVEQEHILNDITMRLIRIEDGITIMKEDIDELEILLKRSRKNANP